MTNQDTNDPLPEDENLGSAGSPHSTGRTLHQRSAEFNQPDRERPPASCEVCNTPIPPTHSRCPDHRSDATAGQETELDWSISNIGFVVVEASTKFAALANASVALRRRDGGAGDDSSYDLIYDFGELSDTLTSNWDSRLPDATKLDTTLGEELYQQAVEKTNCETPQSEATKTIGGVEINTDIIQESSSPNTYLFSEYGTGITETEQLDQFEETPSNPDHNRWLVPAVLYEPNKTSTSSQSEAKHCVTCGTTQHTFEGPIEDKSVSTDADLGVWVCLECGNKTADTIPHWQPPSTPNAKKEPTTEGEKSIKKAEKSEFESVMKRLHQDGTTEHASDTEQS